MFKWINPNIAILEEKVRTQEKFIESLLSEVSLLSGQIDHLRIENQTLLARIFSITGVDRPVEQSRVDLPPQPIQGGGLRTWAEQRRKLEMDAQAKYWEKKKQSAEIASLEKEVLGDKDAS